MTITYVNELLDEGIEKQKLVKPALIELADELDLEFGDYDNIKTHPFDYSIGNCRIEVETYKKGFWTTNFKKDIIKANKWPRGISIPFRRFKGDKDIWVKQSRTGESFIAVDLHEIKELFDLINRNKEATSKGWVVNRNGKKKDEQNNTFREVPFEYIDGKIVICDSLKDLKKLVKNYI